MPLLLPAHFWDGTGGAFIGGVLSFGAAMVVLFVTRASDRQRMQLTAAMQTARDLLPQVIAIEKAADALAKRPELSGVRLLDLLDGASGELLAFSWEVPRKHPGLRSADLQDATDAAFWLGSAAAVATREVLNGTDRNKIAKTASDVSATAAELSMLLTQIRGLRTAPLLARLRILLQSRVSKRGAREV